MTSVTVTDLIDLIPVLAAAYGVVLGVVVLSTGWRLCRRGKPHRYRRGAVVPPVGVTGPGVERNGGSAR